MIRIVLLTAVLTATQLIVPAQAQIETGEGPWCALRNFGSDLSEDCQFRTFEQCRVTVVAGFRGFCNPNPRWIEPSAQRQRRKG